MYGDENKKEKNENNNNKTMSFIWVFAVIWACIVKTKCKC